MKFTSLIALAALAFAVPLGAQATPATKAQIDSAAKLLKAATSSLASAKSMLGRMGPAVTIVRVDTVRQTITNTVTVHDTLPPIVRVDTVIIFAPPPPPAKDTTPFVPPPPRDTTPVIPASAGTPAVLEDFSTYTSTANFLANPRGVWITAEGLNTSRIALDTAVGYGSSTKSMRYDWPNNGAKCLDYQIRPGFLKIPGSQTHVWVEYVVRFATTFTVDAGASCSGKEYKLAALGDYTQGIGRWNVPEMQAGHWVSGYPGNDAGFITGSIAPSKAWDGQPHVFRIEAQLGNGTSTGILRFWIDGVLQVNQSGFQTAVSHHVIDIFGPGLNINQGPALSGMSMWWHRIAVYTTNPGW